MAHRIRAFLVHLCLSALIIGGLLAVVMLLWYPAPLLQYEGALTPVSMVVLVDVIIGPLLTFIVFRPGKRGLVFDLLAIFVLQMAAFGYGAHVLWSQRPLALAFAGDGIYVVGAGELGGRTWPEQLERQRPAFGPMLVYAQPTGSIEHTMAVMEGTAADIQALPQQYRPLADNLAKVAARSADLRSLAQRYQSVKQALKEIPPALLESALAVPIHGRKQSGTVFIDRQSGVISGHHALDLGAVMYLETRRLLQQQADGADGSSTSP